MFLSNPLKLVRRQWERNARSDPYWTILSRPGLDHGRWNREEFFETGRGDVACHLERLTAAGFSPRRGCALDFGCGLGRLSRPLAEWFGSAVGVDVSQRMVELARELHADAPGLRFVHNDRPDLAVFESASFHFVYSMITLQHLPPPLAKGYLAEMVRVCQPTGLIVIQLVTGKRTVGRWFWPPTLARSVWRSLNRRFAFSPVFAMYPLSEPEARSVIVAAGGEILAVWPDGSGGPRFESRIFVVRPVGGS